MLHLHWNMAFRSLAALRWQAPWMLPAAGVVLGVLALAVVWLYPAQVRQVRRPWRWVLPGLRAAALAALALSLARPIALRAREAGDRGTVLVLIDRSRSMSVVDRTRSRADLVAMADGMGLLGPGVRSEVTAALSRDFDALRETAAAALRGEGEVEYARVTGRGVEAAEGRLKEAVDRFDQLSRALADRADAQSSTLPSGPAAPRAELKALREKLRALVKLSRPGSKAPWNAEAKRRLDEAAAALVNYQTAVDERLYDADAGVRRVCDWLGERSRFELAMIACVTPGGGLLARLGPQTPYVAFAFADETTPLPALHPAPTTAPAVADAAAAPGPPSERGALAEPFIQPNGRSTDLYGAVAAAFVRLRTGPVPSAPRAVALFSDGRQVGPEGATSAALAAAGAPIYTIAVAPPAAPRDLAFDVVTLQPPRSAFIGETITVRAALRGGPGGDPASIRLQVDEGANRAPDRLPDPRDASEDRRGGDARRWAEFDLRLSHPGVHRLTLSVAPIAGEATIENNTVQRWIKVLPEKIRVAAFAGAGGWDFQYLRSSLASTPFVELEAGLLDPDEPKLPLSASQLLRQDVVILADVPAAALDPVQWDAVSELVKTRGGSVIFVAGETTAVGEYGDRPLAASLLPFDVLRVRPTWRVWPGERPSFRLTPGEAYRRADVLRLEDGDAAGRRWEELPPLFRIAPAPELKPGASAMLIEPELRSAVLTEMPVGLGRAFYFGANETWRWRMKPGGRDFDRFWQQLIRYAAEAPYAARDGVLALDTDRAAADVGEPIAVRVRLLDPAAIHRPGAAALALEVLRGGAIVQARPLSETVSDSGRYRTMIDGLEAGDYAVRLTGPAPAGGTASIETPLHVIGGDEAELSDLSADLDRLDRLARGAGGDLLRLDQIPRLPDKLRSAVVNRPRATEFPLWDSPYLFIFVIACLAAEWALRKRFGLA